MATEKFQFPINDYDHYGGKIIFQVLEEIPPEFDFHGDIDVESGEDDDPSLIDKIGNFLGESSVRGTTIVKYGPRAILYMPNNIQMQDGVSYERADLGRIGGGVELGIQNGNSLASTFTNSLSDQIGSITEMFGRSLSPDAARYAVTRIAKKAPGNFGESVQSALRVTTNPNTRQLFKEVYIRDFSFSFRLVPTSKEEAEMAKALVKFFRTELYPEDSIKIDAGNGKSIPIGYRYPNTFLISFKHRDNNVLTKLLPAYLVTMSTVYNPTGAGFFEDGNFSEIEVTMNFRESKTLTKNLVRDHGY